MIRSRREEYRHDLGALADDLGAFVRGEDSTDADAAGIYLAQVLDLWRRSMTKDP
jgi:hypothetical protein